MKTCELVGAQLDLWVAAAEGYKAYGDAECEWWTGKDGEFVRQREWTPSKDWAQGGPIIEQLRPLEIATVYGSAGWYVRGRHRPCDGDQFYGETLLVAAMRAYVASKFGDEVPDEIEAGSSNAR